MECPNCNIAFSFQPEKQLNHYDYMDDYQQSNGYVIQSLFCPECKQFIVVLSGGIFEYDPIDDIDIVKSTYDQKIIYPPVKEEFENLKLIPKDYYKEYQEAKKVIKISAKSSAALSRRILQKLLREELNIKKNNLYQEIEYFINESEAPSYIKESIDAIRQYGNIAAHPMKKKESGIIAEVKPTEAEWTLDVLASLFDYIFIQPSLLKNKREELNKKLIELGKREML